MSDSLVVLLHGVGASGADLVPVGQMAAPVLPRTRFVAPDAPYPFDQAPFGRQWFSLAGIGIDNLGGRVAEARAAFDATVAEAIAGAGFGDRLDRVALVGFSQGAIMSLDAVATGRWRGAGVVGFAGLLPLVTPIAPSVRGARVLMVNGEADEVIPLAAGRHTATMLSGAGADLRFIIEPGLGHTISPDGLRQAALFLDGLFADG